MKTSRCIYSLLVFIIMLVALSYPGKASATSWAYSFVVYEGYIYVVSEESVGEEEVEKEIGSVTQYSDMESLPGNFSNAYPVGTKYYSIKGVNTEDMIAVEESEGQYLKAERDGKYASTIEVESSAVEEMKRVDVSLILIFSLGVLVFAGVILLIMIKGRRRE
ncbi:hypothetical protein ACFVAD_08270 [Sutcliffiella sp. NPDC057660]|uniref:hypothetical protein n=1 Tax=Sutcliffiella sp. NPDC057660 TaxID=3346199 RepID=UPI0036CB6605